MDKYRFLLFFAAISSIFQLLHATSGDADPIYIECVGHCKETGCVGGKCFQHCNFSSMEKTINGQWYLQEPLYLRWKQWDCLSDCRYHCMLAREEERQKLGLKPIKYHGKWPFRRVHGIQEPVSVAFSALNLAVQFQGWVSFFILVNYKLPFSPKNKPYYEYTGLWHIYAILSINSWIWSGVSHSRTRRRRSAVIPECLNVVRLLLKDKKKKKRCHPRVLERCPTSIKGDDSLCSGSSLVSF